MTNNPKLESKYRSLAVAKLLALEAAQRRDVRQFRKKYLGGGVIEHKDVADWVKARAEEQQPMLKQELEEKNKKFEAYLEEVKAGTVTHAFADTFPPVLSYAAPDGAVDGVYATSNHASVLRSLVRLARKLHKDYGWNEAAATTFVLTGKIPLSGLVPSYDIHLQFPHCRACSRIVLNVPPWVQEEDLLQLYRKARADEKFKALGARYPRSISKRTYKLIDFVTDRLKTNPKPSWQEMFCEWNKAMPRNMRFKNCSEMATLYNRAKKTLLGSSALKD